VESREVAQDESNHQNQLLLREIDAHKRTDAALQKAKEVAEAANLAKTRFVTGMSHEFRTPLNSILGYSQVLLRSAASEAVRGPVATIQRSGQHLSSLVDGMLDLARIEAGRMRIEPAAISLRDFLDDLVRMVEPQAHAKGLDFQLELPARALPAYVQADAKRLRQILLNLLSNAIKFTAEGRVVLRVSHRMEVARFEVEDTGLGIAPHDIERIFLPFERSSSGRIAHEPGTGLGLAITQLLADLMGGELSVTSTVNQGSCFKLRLYMRELTAIDQHQVENHRRVIGYRGERRRLLLVDDQPEQRQLMAAILIPLGFAAQEAASGPECLEAVASHPPDMVLLDVNMGEMDGWATCRALRQAGHAALPVVMVSANVFHAPEQLDGSGCNGFVTKPVAESELLGQLERLLQLEWIHEAPPAAVAQEAAAPLAHTLSNEATAELIWLARIGDLGSLKRGIARMVAADPATQRECDYLRQLVDRVDLESLLRWLQRE
jgi:CheY-like chemotaxis protein